MKAWTARQVAFLFIAPPDNLTAEQASYLVGVRKAQPALAAAYALAQDFMTILRRRAGERLDDWIERAAASACAELRSFAMGLLPDKDAVEAGLTLEWSTGPCEGHIHRLKLIKRSLYGKASFPLLRQRVLRAACVVWHAPGGEEGNDRHAGVATTVAGGGGGRLGALSGHL